ncbi:MAG: NADH-ubiquinone oxidoreductase [Sulfurovum sp. FS08-3]|nr:MAG: NADH-ubiquinone oxidoreductase [Sulfurovum sp. FS08-3]
MFEIDMLFAFGLFSIGLYGVTSKKDFLRIFFALEMLLNAVILMLASGAVHLGATQNIPLAYMVIVFATLEAAVGILIFALSNRLTNKVIPDTIGGIQ